MICIYGGVAVILCCLCPGGVGGERSALDGHPLWLHGFGSWLLESWRLGGYIGVLLALAPQLG